MSGFTKTCKECGAKVWETYPGAHTETSELEEDYCDDCERDEIARRTEERQAYRTGTFKAAMRGLTPYRAAKVCNTLRPGIDFRGMTKGGLADEFANGMLSQLSGAELRAAVANAEDRRHG